MKTNSADLELFRAAFETNGSPHTPQRLHWQYAANPNGEPCVDFALDEPNDNSKIAAIYATMPVTFDLAGHTVPGVQSVDTLTDREFRGRGLFVTMAEQVYQRCADEGVRLVYGFPNQNSAHGFFHKLGWTELGPVPFLIRPLRTGYFLRSIERLRPVAFIDLGLPLLPDLPWSVRTLGPWVTSTWQKLASGSSEVAHAGLRRHPCIRPVDRFGVNHDELWDEIRSGIGVAVRRDARYLNWRLVDRPLEKHTAAIRQLRYEDDGTPRISEEIDERYVTLEHTDKNGLQGFVTYCLKEKHGGRLGYIMELLVRQGGTDIGVLLLRHALADLAFARADAVLAWNLPFSPNHRCFFANGFFPLPRRFQPIELHFGVRCFAPEAGLAADVRNWYLSYCDSDTV